MAMLTIREIAIIMVNATVIVMMMWTGWNSWMIKNMMVIKQMMMTQVVDGVARLVESSRVELKSNDGKDHDRKHHLKSHDDDLIILW